MIAPFKIESDDKSLKQAYIEKCLEKYYVRKINKRRLLLSRDECVSKYGDGEFFHLNVHSKFSALSGSNEPSELFNAAKSLNQKGLAITEIGYLSSIPDAWQASKDTKLKYIAGICAHFSDYEESRRSLPEEEIKNHQFLINACAKYKTPTITVLAKNKAGYKDLLQLNNESWQNGYYYTPRITRSMLKKFNNGNFVILSGSLIDKFVEFGYISDIDHKEYLALSALDYLKWFHNEFKDDFYVEMTMKCQDTVWGSDLDRFSTIHGLIKSSGMNIKYVVTNDVFYLDRSDELVYKALLAIQRNTLLKNIRDYSQELYLKNRAELRATYDMCSYNGVIDRNEFELACDNSIEISNKCESFIADTSPKLPNIPNAAEILRKEVAKSLIEKGMVKDQKKYEVDGKMVTYVEQTKLELDRFISKGFESYFLIMRDLIKHSYDCGKSLGPSRGCCTPDSIINTIDGKKRIDDIKIDDFVYDGFNDIKKVLNVLKYDIDEELFNIEYGDKSMNTTSDHKLYIIRDNKVMLCKASEIKNTDELIISEAQHNIGKNEFKM
jgi:DNA polymerase-3 subunit alpha